MNKHNYDDFDEDDYLPDIELLDDELSKFGSIKSVYDTDDDLPDLELDNSSDEYMEECAICVNDYNKLNSIFHFSCKHTFCITCTNDLQQNKHNVCPMCRSNRIVFDNKLVLNEEQKNNLLDGNIFVDHIYLDSAERRKFSRTGHEYLIDQPDCDQNSKKQNNIKLNFNHPVKELIWLKNSKLE